MKTLRMMLSSLAGLVLVAGTVPASADYHVQTINTNSLAYGTFGTDSDSIGPLPFSNFGVSGSYSIANDIAAGVQGSTAFTFPTISPGDTFYADNSKLQYAYAPVWTGASIGMHTGLSASASFTYDIGPFSGSKSIYDTATNATASGTLGVGSTLTGGSAQGLGVGSTANFGYGLNAYVGSASVGGSVGLNVQNNVSYSPTVSYGYYSWVNKSGGLSGADNLTWTSVASGDLSYLFPHNLSAAAGSDDFYLHFLPAVRMNMPIDTSATISVPLTGTFHVDAFGQTLVDLALPLGNLYSDTRNYDTWNDDVQWAGSYYSLHLHESYQDCNVPGMLCDVYDVLGSPLLSTQALLPGDSTSDFHGGSTGGFDPGTGHAPLVPQACDPHDGQCYASNDPDMPIGPGTVTFQVSDVPEPSSWGLMFAGFMLVGGRLRRIRRKTLVDARFC